MQQKKKKTFPPFPRTPLATDDSIVQLQQSPPHRIEKVSLRDAGPLALDVVRVAIQPCVSVRSFRSRELFGRPRHLGQLFRLSVVPVDEPCFDFKQIVSCRPLAWVCYSPLLKGCTNQRQSQCRAQGPPRSSPPRGYPQTSRYSSPSSGHSCGRSRVRLS